MNGVESALLAGVEVPGLSLEQRRTSTQRPPSPLECSRQWRSNGALLTSWPRMLVFLRLLVRPDPLEGADKSP